MYMKSRIYILSTFSMVLFACSAPSSQHLNVVKNETRMLLDTNGSELKPSIPPSVISVPQVSIQKLATNREQIEIETRNLLKNSSISTISIILTSVNQLSSGTRPIAAQRMTADSPIWLVNVVGTLHEVGPAPVDPQGNPLIASSNKMRILFSAESGELIAAGLENPDFSPRN